MSIGLAQAWGSALLAGVLSSCFAKKKVAKEEGDPRVGAGYSGPLRYSPLAGTAELGLRPQTVLALYPPAAALLSDSHGDPKSVSEPGAVERIDSHGQPGKKPKNEIHRFSVDALPGPLRGAEQRRKAGGSRRGLSEGRSPEFRSRPAFRVAQGTGNASTDPGSPSFCLLFLGEARKSETPRKGGTHSQTRKPRIPAFAEMTKEGRPHA